MKLKQSTLCKVSGVLSGLLFALSVSTNTYAIAPVPSGFFFGIGVAAEHGDYGFTRHLIGKLDSQDTAPKWTHQNDAERTTAPQWLIGYQYILGHIYIGGELSQNYSDFGFKTNQHVFITDIINDAPYTTDYGFSSTTTISNPVNLIFQLGWAIVPCTLIYAEGGVSYGRFSSTFLSTAQNQFGDPATENDSDHWSFSRVGTIIGVGVAQQLTQHLQLRADYNVTRYAQAEHVAIINPLDDATGRPSVKWISLRTERVSLSFVYTVA